MKRQVTYDPPASKRSRSNRKTYRKATRPRAQTGVRRVVEAALRAASETKLLSQISNEITLSTIAPIPVVDSMPAPAVGPVSNQRIGNKIKPVGYSTKFLIHNNTAVGIYVRLVLVCINAGEAMTDTEVRNQIFEGTFGQDVTMDGTIGDLQRKINREDFKVLRDVLLPIPSGGSSTSADNLVQFKHYQKLSGEMKFHDSVNSHPVSARYAWILLARESAADESLGSIVEISTVRDFYFKE